MSHGNSRFVLLGFLVSALVAAPPQVLGDVTSQTWINRGTAVYQQIGNTLGIPGSSLFAEVASLGGGQSGGSDGTAYAWPLSTMLRVDGSLAALNPVKYDPVLLGLSNQFYSQYWNAASGGYQSGTAAGSTIYYDDNAHVAVALAEDYQITGNPVYLTRAEQTEAFVLSGSDSAGGGGIYWTTGCGYKDTVATLQGARAALLIYQSTGQAGYLTDATQLYNWAATHTQESNGLFMQQYYVTGSSANTAEGTPLVNAAGIGISCNVQFYKATHNASYLTEAETIANTALTSYFNSTTGAINDEGYWAFELTDGLLDLYQIDHNARWLNATTGGVQYLYSDMRDPNGNYGLYWGRGGPQVGALSSWDLNNQAPVARAYLYLGQALAVSSTWAVATSGSWAAGSNWTANSPPANGDGTNVYIATATNSPSLLNITLDGQQTVGTIYLSNTASQKTGYNITSGSAGGSQLLVLSNTANSAQVIVTSGMHAISAPVSLASNLVISLSSSSTLAISGNIAGTGQSLTLAYGGSLILSGVNTYSGGTNISGGTVSVSADNNLGGASGGLALGTGGTLLSTASFTTNRSMTLSSGGGIFAQNSGTISLTASGPISGSGGLTQAGPATLVLTASNTYSGATAVSGGTLSVGNGGNGASIGSTSGVTLSNGANLTFNHGDAVTWNQVITGDGSFTDTGTGTLTITAAQSYSGPTIVGGGVLKLDSSSPLAYTEYRFTPTKVYSGTQLQMSELQYYLPNGTRVQANSVSSSAITWGDSPVSNINDNNTATKYGTDNGVDIPIVFTYTSPRAFTSYNWATGNDTSTYTGRNPVRWTVQASNNGINWVTLDDKSGADQSVTFANSTFQTGWTLSNTGSASSNTLPTTTALTIGANATLDLGGGSQQVASLSDYAPGSGGSIINSNTGAASVLTLSPTGGSTTFSGMIQGGSTLGTISLVISGSGTQVLAGTNTYTGGTTVAAGNLVVAGSLGNSAVSVGPAASLGGTGTIGGTVAVRGGAGPLAGGAIDLVDGTVGTLTLSDPNAADTVLTIGTGAVGSPSLLNFEVGATADRILVTAGKVAVNSGGGTIDITALKGFGPGTYDLIDFLGGQASGLGNLTLGTPTLPGYTLSLRPTTTSEQLVVSSVPEPGTLGLLTAAVACGLAVRHRRRRGFEI